MVASVFIFDAFTTAIFLVVAVQFLFPSNSVIPLDRRLSGLLGASLCIVTQWAIPHTTLSKVSVTDFINVDVLVILLAVMVINFVLMRQSFQTSCIRQLQGEGAMQSSHFTDNNPQ